MGSHVAIGGRQLESHGHIAVGCGCGCGLSADGGDGGQDGEEGGGQLHFDFWKKRMVGLGLLQRV